jgi:cytoskeletal protein CcmA (bactofilin family)
MRFKINEIVKMNQKSYPEVPSQNINLISSGTKITGDVVAEGDIRIDGSLKGNIKSKGRLVIGSSGSVEGEILCANIEVAGKFKGKISAAELLTMKATAVVSGDIIATKLAVEPGSLFTGSCQMGPVPEKIPNELHK